MDRVPFRNVKWFVLGYFVLLILILTFIGICGQLGYVFINMNLCFGLFGLLLCSALIAGTVWLVRRIQAKAAKILVGSMGVLITFAVAVILVMVSTLMLNLLVFSMISRVRLPIWQEIISRVGSPATCTQVLMMQPLS